MNRFRLAWFAFLLLPAACPLAAQVASGTIVGVVDDASGAAIVGANVTLVHQGTQESRQVRTNERGEFSAPFLRIGQYAVTAEAQGFQSQRQTGIELQVDKTLDLRFTMKVGAISERVEVSAAAPLIDTATSSLGQVIGNKRFWSCR